jgi:alpha-glucosidase (family GH31 glycosyl hydrolase)
MKTAVWSLLILGNLAWMQQWTAPTTTTQIPVRPGEKWWVGVINKGEIMPLPDSSERLDLWHNNWNNQVQPLLLSSQGRFIWSHTPFDLQMKQGALHLQSEEALKAQTGGATLREAFISASRQYFPSNGKMPDHSMFSQPQWNTWIELGYNQNQHSILKYAHTILSEGFPPGLIMLDDTWQEDYGVWRFHPGRFPEPKAMIDELHRLGFKVMLWVIPCVSPDSYEYRSLLQQKALLLERPHPQSDHYVAWADRNNQPAMIRWWNGTSAVLDLTHAAAFTWFKTTLQGLQKNYAIDGFKFDGGDWYFYPPYTTSPHHASYHAEKYCEIGLDFPLNEYRSAWKMAGQPLAHRLQDKNHNWQDLQSLIPHMLIQGLSGYSFGCPDMIGGGMLGSFENAPFNQDLMVRSAQIHAAMPMMQFSIAPWRVLDTEHLQAVKKAVELRRNWFEPHIMRLAKVAAQTGEPIVRHLEYVFPHQGMSELKDQFMLGDSIMIAPITSASNHRQVKLPAGFWRADDGQVYRGPTSVDLNVPLDRLPFFVLQAPPKPLSKTKKSKK